MYFVNNHNMLYVDFKVNILQERIYKIQQWEHFDFNVYTQLKWLNWSVLVEFHDVANLKQPAAQLTVVSTWR